MNSNSIKSAIPTRQPLVARPYAVGVFDVLGFKNRFEKLGLEEITARYSALIDIVVKRDQHLAEMKKFFSQMKEGPFWCAEAKLMLNTKVYAAYASDTFLVWANFTWTEFYEHTDERLEELSRDSNHDWLFYPIPCDPFLDVCNELICRSLQVGLPLRGAIAVGEAVLDKDRNIFLGRPIIDANLLEHRQKFIGAGLCNSFVNQTVPKRYKLSLSQHLKDPSTEGASGLILDWPRHWRNTRTTNLKRCITSMNTDDRFSGYYENTLASVEESEVFAKEFESPEGECALRSNYEQFSYAREGNIAAHVMLVREVSAEEIANLTSQSKGL